MNKQKDKTPDDLRQKELQNKLEEAKEKGKTLSSIGREFTKEGQFVEDLTDALSESTPFFPENADWEGMIDGWDSWNERAEKGIEQVKIAFPTTTGTTSSAVFSSTGVVNMANIISLPKNVRPEAEDAFSRVHQVVSRNSRKEDVISLLDNFGLNQAPKGKKSPLELFTTSYQAFENPVSDANPVSSSLIPMRDSIQETIDELLRRRPIQEETEGQYGKIISIGGQLKKDVITEKDVHTWAGQWKTLKGELSSSKTEAFDRLEWERRLQRATLFLDSFLKGLDPSKMRK